MKVKICGLCRMEDISYVNACLPDYVGFVFAESRRQVTPKQAKEMREALDSHIQTVGVFVNENMETILRLCSQGILDLIQLHGDEDEDYLKRLAAGTDVPIIRAVRVQSTQQILEAQQRECDYLLLDTYIPGQYGGGGKSFDPKLVPPLSKPWFLAGGLDPGNIEEKLAGYRPFGVDVSSGVETEGRKDPEKIRAFIEQVRGLNKIWKMENLAYSAGSMCRKP